MEYTGLYAHDFRIWLESEGLVYYMVDPNRMHYFEPPLSIKGIRQTKTDKADAFRIAIYCSLFYKSMSPSYLPSSTYFILKRLLAERLLYVKQAAKYKQQRRDVSLYDTVDSRIRKEEELKKLNSYIWRTEKDIRSVIQSDSLIKRNYDLLTSIVGIGMVIAVTTIVLTENFTAFTDPRKYASYIAIAPFPHESLPAISLDPGIRSYWLRKKAEGKHSGIIMNAIKFKLVLRMFAVVKRGKPYVIIDKF